MPNAIYQRILLSVFVVRLHLKSSPPDVDHNTHNRIESLGTESDLLVSEFVRGSVTGIRTLYIVGGIYLYK